MKQCLHILVSGKVYKTGYRYFLKQQATKLEISGYVQYTGNQSAKVFASGKKENLNAFIVQCCEGNQGSSINEILIQQSSYKRFSSFEVIEQAEVTYTPNSLS